MVDITAISGYDAYIAIDYQHGADARWQHRDSNVIPGTLEAALDPM